MTAVLAQYLGDYIVHHKYKKEKYTGKNIRNY